MICHSLLQWTTLCQTSPPWPDRLGWPHMAWLSFIEFDTTVVLWLDWLVFFDYGFSGSALWFPLVTPTILLGFLVPGRGVSLHGCSSKAQPLLLTLDKGYLLMAAPPDLECGVVLLSPLHPAAATPWKWGSSSRPPPLTSGKQCQRRLKLPHYHTHLTH